VNGQEIISVRGLRKSYGTVVALDGVSFSVDRGEVFGIVGPNGAGKTTTVECMVGLRRQDAGEIRVLGLDPTRQARALHRLVGVQLQESALPDGIRVWEALVLFASLHARPADWRALLRDWGLEGKRSARFSSLSGGQRQRLFVALALVNDPRLVFLDELTSGLDPEARRASWDMIDGLRNRGTTVVLVTHSMEEAEALCDRVAIIDRGRILALDAPRKLVETLGSGAPARTRWGAAKPTLEDVYLRLTRGEVQPCAGS
jgi:ABC-2 type transport system ATP-binding protein